MGPGKHVLRGYLGVPQAAFSELAAGLFAYNVTS